MTTTAVFAEDQFVDATGPGGLNQAFGVVSGSVMAVGSGAFSVPGLLSPEAMTIGVTGLTMAVGLPLPWGLITGGGSVVRAHGTVSGSDSQSATVNFSSFLPSTGTTTAYVAATLLTISGTSVPIAGPQSGHPSFDPLFVPIFSYTVNIDSVSVGITTTPPDNLTAFKLLRTVLTPAQGSIATYSTAAQQRAGLRKALPGQLLASGGVLTIAQAQRGLSPAVSGLTHTLPDITMCGGLSFNFANTSNGVWTIVTSGSNVIAGLSSGTTNSIALPVGASMGVYAPASGTVWEIASASPNLLLNQTNIWTNPNTFTSGIILNNSVYLQGKDTSGTPRNLIHIDSSNNVSVCVGTGGFFGVNNAAGTASLLTVDTAGDTSITGSLSVAAGVGVGSDISIVRNATVGNTLVVVNQAQVYNSLVIETGNLSVNNGVASVNGAISSVGNITANSGRLRATFGALNSGDTNAATLLADFSFTTNGGSGYIYQQLPSGFIIQGNIGANASGADFIAFPIAFPNICVECIPCEGAPQGWNGGTRPTVFGSQQLGNTGFALYITQWNGSSWSLVGPITYRYIAIGY